MGKPGGEHTGRRELACSRQGEWPVCLGWGQRESDGTGGSCQVACGAGKGLVLYSNQMRRLKRVLNREGMRSVTFTMNESRGLSTGVGKESGRLLYGPGRGDCCLPRWSAAAMETGGFGVCFQGRVHRF